MNLYKITNNINTKCYIGITNNIKRRFSYHRRKRDNENVKEYDKPLYRAFRKYGIQNFTFEVILTGLLKKEAEEKEIEYIKIYNSLTHGNGYNIREGGNLSGDTLRGENHFFSKMTDNDVRNIIYQRDIMHKRPIKVYEDYKDKIAYATFESVWIGKSWLHMQPTIIHFHKHKISVGTENPKAKLTEEEVLDIISKRQSLVKRSVVFKEYSDRIGNAGFTDIWLGRRWKHLQPKNIKSANKGFLSDTQVLKILESIKNKTKTQALLALEYSVPTSTISNIKNNKLYKHVQRKA